MCFLFVVVVVVVVVVFLFFFQTESESKGMSVQNLSEENKILPTIYTLYGLSVSKSWYNRPYPFMTIPSIKYV